MMYQLLKYAAAAPTAPRRPASLARSARVTHAVTTASMTNSAGSSRRARCSQKSPSLIFPIADHWLTRMLVIRKPLSVKKTPTPSNPPGAHPNCSWYAMTASTAMPAIRPGQAYSAGQSPPASACSPQPGPFSHPSVEIVGFTPGRECTTRSGLRSTYRGRQELEREWRVATPFALAVSRFAGVRMQR